MEKQLDRDREALQACRKRVADLESENERLEMMMRRTSEQALFDINLLKQSLIGYDCTDGEDEGTGSERLDLFQ